MRARRREMCLLERSSERSIIAAPMTDVALAVVIVAHNSLRRVAPQPACRACRTPAARRIDHRRQWLERWSGRRDRPPRPRRRGYWLARQRRLCRWGERRCSGRARGDLLCSAKSRRDRRAGMGGGDQTPVGGPLRGLDGARAARTAATASTPAAACCISPVSGGQGRSVSRSRRPLLDARSGVLVRGMPGHSARTLARGSAAFRSTSSCTARTSTSRCRLRLLGGQAGGRARCARRPRLRFVKGERKWRLLERNRWATVLRTYPAPLLALVMPALLATELAVWAVAVRGRWGRAKARATIDVMRELPRHLAGAPDHPIETADRLVSVRRIVDGHAQLAVLRPNRPPSSLTARHEDLLALRASACLIV